jgi:hypothetical protein
MIPDSIEKNPDGEVAKKAVANIALFTSTVGGVCGDLAPHVQHYIRNSDN